jgi:uncharacterized protein
VRALLDVNVLIALLDAQHVHHARARDWVLRNAGAGWASCPFTQNGCVRIMSQPRYTNPLPASTVMERLAEATHHPSHEFWAADISLLDEAIADRSRFHGPRQITDLYLLALAVRKSGRFVTFDGSIPLSAIRGATAEALVVI